MALAMAIAAHDGRVGGFHASFGVGAKAASMCFGVEAGPGRGSGVVAGAFPN